GRCPAGPMTAWHRGDDASGVAVTHRTSLVTHLFHLGHRQHNPPPTLLPSRPRCGRLVRVLVGPQVALIKVPRAKCSLSFYRHSPARAGTSQAQWRQETGTGRYRGSDPCATSRSPVLVSLTSLVQSLFHKMHTNVS